MYSGKSRGKRPRGRPDRVHKRDTKEKELYLLQKGAKNAKKGKTVLGSF